MERGVRAVHMSYPQEGGGKCFDSREGGWREESGRREGRKEYQPLVD